MFNQSIHLKVTLPFIAKTVAEKIRKKFWISSNEINFHTSQDAFSSETSTRWTEHALYIGRLDNKYGIFFAGWNTSSLYWALIYKVEKYSY